MSEINFPQCLCGAWFEWVPFEINGKFRAIFSEAWKCNLCGRPACFIKNDGGNAFVVPTADVEIFSPQLRGYIFQVKLLFTENAERLKSLREQYENMRYLEVCFNHGARPDFGLRHYPQDIRIEIAKESGHIFIEPGWERPYGFNPNPMPPFIPFARVYFFAPGTPPELDPEKKYWFFLTKANK